MRQANIVWANNPGWPIRDRMLYENFANRWRIRHTKDPTNQYSLVLRGP